MADAPRTVADNSIASTNEEPEANAGVQGRIAELRVSAHLMRLDTGVFCVFPVPGSPRPDVATGLPGVRITHAPGSMHRPDTVSIATFRNDGWLDGTAALIRVAEGPASILVTIYQHAQHSADAAPKLQVMQLSADAAVAEPPVEPTPAAEPALPAGPEPEVMAHVQRTGDMGGQIGDWIGVKGSRLWIEGFGVSPHNDLTPDDIEYQGVLGRGWLSPWVDGGKYCGSRDMALPLLGLKVRLKGEAAKNFDCTYSATFIDGSAVGPIPAGEACEAESLAALESFQIEVHRRTPGSAPARKPVARTARPKAPARIVRR